MLGLNWGEVSIIVAALVGFAAFVSFIVNVLKFFGVVKDGTSDKWIAGFNLVGVLALFITLKFIPDFDVMPIDNVLGEIAVVGSAILSYVTMLLGSKLTYFASKGLPLIGKSYSA